MLSIMNYLGFNNVIERLQRILRLLSRCLQPKSGVPKYIPRPPDSDDEEDDWDAESPIPGQQPQRPQRPHVQPTGGRAQMSTRSRDGGT
jgi:hypothetical protein